MSRRPFLRSLIWLVSVAASTVPHSLAAQEGGARSAPTTRHIAFHTNEGTWISLDVSRDGREIAFELLGDLYLLPIAGGNARPIVSGSDFASQPRYSPDGASLLFVSDRSGSDNIWIAARDGSLPRQLTHMGRQKVVSPSWSSDGRSIFATLAGGAAAGAPRTAELWEFDVATGEGKRLLENGNGAPSLLVSTPAPGPYGAAPAPDGNSVYYAGVTPRAYGVRAGASSSVFRYRRDTRRPEPLVLEGTNAMKPLVSPNGELLAYVAQHESRARIRVRILATGKERVVSPNLDRDELEATATRDVVPNYAFTPDGTALIVAYGGGIHRIDLATLSDARIPFEARMEMDVPSSLRLPQRIAEAPVRARFVQHPALGPNGEFAFSAMARIYVADSVRGTPTRLTTTEHPREFYPAWSPDGKWVAYVTWEPDGGALWKARADRSTPPQRLTNNFDFYAEPSWSADGTRLLLLHAPAGSARRQPMGFAADADFAWISVEGGQLHRIAAAQGAHRPTFSADGSRIVAFAPNAGVVSMLLDGSDRRVRASINYRPGLFDATAPDGAAAPDGKSVATLLGERLVRLALDHDVAMGDTITLNPALGALVAADGPESFAFSPDGSTIAWTTGRVVHWKRDGTGEDSAVVSVEVPRATPKGTIVLRGARAITMRGDEVIAKSDIVIQDNRIISIVAQGSAPLPRNARVLQLTGKTIIPGIVDIHAHWAPLGGVLKPEFPAPLANLAYGVTTIRDPQITPDIFSYADLADAGEMPSPRIFSAGPGLFETLNFQSLDEARRRILRYRDRYETRYLKSYTVGTRQQRQWVVQASRELGMIPTTEGAADAKQNLTHALDGFSGNEHAIPDVPLYKDIVQLFAQSGITYTPTLLVAFGGPFPIYRMFADDPPTRIDKLRRFFPREELYQRTATRLLYFPESEQRWREQAAGAAAVLRAGGHVALGGHGEMQGLQVHWEMQLLTGGGMTPMEALRVATIEGALALGLDRDIGTLERGKLADLVILDRDPRSDIRNTRAIRSVMKNGVLYDGETLAEEWPLKRPAPRTWWSVEDAAR